MSETLRGEAVEAAAPQEDTEKLHEQFREEIRELVAHVSREAAREKPSRHIRFSESPIGSRIFLNLRLKDKKTGAVMSEEIFYDPSLFWRAPPGAFYALLWHEFGHGEPRLEAAEERDRIVFEEQFKTMPHAVDELGNVKTDILIDANNRHDRPGLVAPYRATYEHFFPRDFKVPVPQLEEIGGRAGWSATATELARRIQTALERPKRFLLALKHEAYWHHEDERTKVPEEARLEPPFLKMDPTLKEPFERVLSTLIEVGNGKKGTPGRSDIFNKKIAPEYFALVEEQKKEIETAVDQALKEMGLTRDDLRRMQEAIRQAAKEVQAEAARRRAEDLRGEASRRRDKADQTERDAQTRAVGRDAEALEARRRAEDLHGKKGQEAAARDAERQATRAARDAKDIRQAGKDRAEKLRREADEHDEEAKKQEATAEGEPSSRPEAKPKDPARMRAEPEEPATPQEPIEPEKSEPEEPIDPKEEAERIIEAVEDYTKIVPSEESVPHAEHEDEVIDESDPRHPDNPHFGELFPESPKPENPPPTLTPSDRGAADMSAEQTRLQKLKEWGITPEADREYREVRRLLDERQLDDLVNGLTALFLQDRERTILTGQVAGRLPTSRKAEALRRRYAGEAMPPVREIKKIVERFMGVDLIISNDHSGSMRGDKQKAAKATNTAIAIAAYRVNSELARRMRALGLSDAELARVPPLRYLGLLFSDSVVMMNRRGWEESLSARHAMLDEQHMESEKFVIEMFNAYQELAMRGTNDHLAAALALYEAFGKEQPGIKKSEERVKVFCFITDGVGAVGAMTQLMTFLHGKSEEFPSWVIDALNRIEHGSASRVEERIRKYRDQIFAFGIGIPSYPEETETFLSVYNEGEKPDSNDPRSLEKHNVAVVPLAQVRTMPERILRMMQAKFRSSAFRRIRDRFSPPGRGRKTRG